MSYEFDNDPRGMSAGAKVAVGCGVAAILVAALVCGGVVFLGFRIADTAEQLSGQIRQEMERQRKQADAFATQFEDQGYDRVDDPVIEITNDITKPTVYSAQVFTLNANSEASLAVMASVAEIRGTINGDLHFSGQTLAIKPGSVITGDVYIEKAQMFDNDGTVEGEIIRTSTEDPADAATPADPAALPELKPTPGDVIDTDPDAPTPESANADGPGSETPDTEPPPNADEQDDIPST